ncbi:stage II sporulation protein R [Oscillospiraceae bacterium LTW-04]|nr:stage II sporulation protein R [Oscillospiraceae bacterium MB24-C1]
MTKTDRFALTLFLTLMLSMLLLSFDSFAAQCAAVRQNTLRLHIIANSDLDEDQQHKLLVRDALLQEYSELLGGEDAAQAARIAEFLRDDITLTAQKTLQAAGDMHNVAVSVTDMYFDTRTYEDGVTLPAGEYTALRVVIGEGKGKNWWCVMYPPLCIPVATQEQAAEVEEQIRTLSVEPCYQAKFAVVEAFEKLTDRASE